MPGNLLAQAPVADWPEAEGAKKLLPISVVLTVRIF